MHREEPMTMRPYTELPAVQHFVLEESWVVAIEAYPGRLAVTVDFVYAFDHPEILPPRTGELYYGRVGLMEFTGVRSLNWCGQGAPPAREPDGSVSWDVDGMTWAGTNYELSGDFGIIHVDAEAIVVRMTGPA
jgi:hypothetical protein